jgi:hypothetical protein
MKKNKKEIFLKLKKIRKDFIIRKIFLDLCLFLIILFKLIIK